MYDLLYIAGPAIMTLVFTAFAITISKEDFFLKNLFFFSAIISLLLLVNMSMKVAESGDWMVGSYETFNSYNVGGQLTNSTVINTWVQKPPSFNAPDWKNIWYLVGTALLIPFVYGFLKLLQACFELLNGGRRIL